MSHSRSPLIHGTWIRTHGVEGRYDAIEIKEAGLAGFLQRVRSGEFAGGNVTIPHKEAVLRLCDGVDPLALRIGAVNTLVGEGGRILGFNTDYMGFLGNLDQQAPGWSDGLEAAIVLGAGGAARAILVALAERGVGQVHILNRTLEKAQRLAADIEGPFEAAPLEAFAALAPRTGLVVNTTAIGMHGSAFERLPLAALPPTALVTDIVYVPLRTPLLAEAEALGLRTVDGLGMLLHQAIPGFEAWFGVRPEVTAELRALVAATL